jgi:hypothetical protein
MSTTAIPTIPKRVKSARINQLQERRILMSEPTVDYWRAKAELCRDLALIQIEDEKTEKEAGMNLMRMTYALSMVDTFNEGGEDNEQTN